MKPELPETALFGYLRISCKYLQYKDVLVNDMLNTKYDVVYARVSTHKQRERGDVDRQVLEYASQALKRSKKGFVGLSGTDIWIETDKNVKFVRLVPNNGCIKTEIGYE